MTLSDRVARSLVSAKINHWLLFFFFFIRESHGGSDFERHFVMKNCIKIFLNTLNLKNRRRFDAIRTSLCQKSQKSKKIMEND